MVGYFRSSVAASGGPHDKEAPVQQRSVDAFELLPRIARQERTKEDSGRKSGRNLRFSVN
jgi:hypothetical protein